MAFPKILAVKQGVCTTISVENFCLTASEDFVVETFWCFAKRGLLEKRVKVIDRVTMRSEMSVSEEIHCNGRVFLIRTQTKNATFVKFLSQKSPSKESL